jgi:hypothetical protein
MNKLMACVLPDTNYLMDYPNLLDENWLLQPLEILLSETVVAELRGLANNYQESTSKKAQAALAAVEKLRGSLAELTKTYPKLKITFVPRCVEVSDPLEPHDPDHQIIAQARSFLYGRGARFCAILSNDKRLCHIAQAMAVITVNRYPNQFQRFHEELQLKHQFWRPPLPLVAALSPSRSAHPIPDPISRLDKFIRSLYRRVQAAQFRATINLAPLHARIAFAAHMIQRVRKPEKQIILITVESNLVAHYWAGEIRQKTGLNASQVQLFGQDDLGRFKDIRAIIFRREQIVRRIPDFLAQAQLDQQRVLAIVDGCDLLEPVDVAVLLYHCASFVGFNHYPIGSLNTPGNQIISVLLRNQALLSYSFADAQREGWGTSHTFFSHPVTFTSDDQEIWHELTIQYLKLREKLLQEQPSLKATDNFWEGLHRILEATATPEAGELFKIREQREQCSQLASQKIQVLRTIFNSSPRSISFKRIVFDYARQWTPVLLKEFNSEKFRVVEWTLELRDPIHLWNEFEQGKIDVLIFSHLPSFELRALPFHQLIILTPLHPLGQLNAMIDWAMAHTKISEPFKIELLYTENTPEELAMLDLAAASFGLHYHGKKYAS